MSGLLVIVGTVVVLCVVHERHTILLVVPIVVMALQHPVRCFVCLSIVHLTVLDVFHVAMLQEVVRIRVRVPLVARRRRYRVSAGVFRRWGHHVVQELEEV